MCKHTTAQNLSCCWTAPPSTQTLLRQERYNTAEQLRRNLAKASGSHYCLDIERESRAYSSRTVIEQFKPSFSFSSADLRLHSIALAAPRRSNKGLTGLVSRLHKPCDTEHHNPAQLSSSHLSRLSACQCLFLPPSRTKSPPSNVRSPKLSRKTSCNTAQTSSIVASHPSVPSSSLEVTRRTVA